MSKRPIAATDSGQVDDGSGASQVNHDENEDNSPEFEEPITSKKGNDACHGNRFQSKLLMLYGMRAMNAGYQFYLGTELEDVGGKFDDLIFKYKDKNDTTTGRYQYLQAKHKLNENDKKNQINAIQLLGTSKDKNFDLMKYFQSYLKIKTRGDDVEHCIICTNVNFDHFDLKKNDIILLGVKKSSWPKILGCAVYKTQQAFYKFKVNDKLRNHMHALLMSNDPLVCDFFDKLIFSVNTPNEDELDSILAKEIGKHFNQNNELPSAYVMNEMVNWFKQTDKIHHWLTPEKAKEIINGKVGELMALNNTTAISIDYQQQLGSVVGFNDTSIDKLVKELKSFWDNSQEKIKHIKSETPKLTAVKVISAMEKLTECFPYKDDYLVISSNRLKTSKKDLDAPMKVEISHKLLVVVDEDANPQLNVDCENLIPAKSKKKIILISNRNLNNESYQDPIAYEHLSEKTKEILGKKQVAFQETNLTVSDLIYLDKASELFGSNLIQNFLIDDSNFEIPSFTSSNFQEYLYIKRQVVFPSTDDLIKKLSRKRNFSVEIMTGKCNVDSNGRIQWLAKDEKEKLWKDMKDIIKEMNSSDSSLLDIVLEEQLIDPNNKKRVIIMGVAGTGKSTILSHYYKEIKKKYSDWWVIKLSLVDFTSTLRESDSKEDASNFFIKATGIDQNPFAQLLLKHRLEMGDRIVIMLDGFDEIDTECQKKIVQLMKNLNESIPLYITTRPHMVDELQFELSQLAYSLVKFTEKDQINYITSIWKTDSNKEGVDYDSFARELICKVSKTLKDKEKEFLGIPLQCRILAECFQSKIITVETVDDFSHLLDSQQFDLANLYRMMFEEKRSVFRKEKIKVNSVNNHIVNESIEKNIRKTELYLRKIAIQIIVEENVDILIPSTSFKSEEEREAKEKQLNESGIRLGFLDKNDGNRIHFLHRTFAEYLVADYIYNGFLLDEERHNKLLENETIRKWIIQKLLMEDKYNGVRVFFDSMLKEIINQKKWKNRIKQRNLPDRLRKFSRLLCDERKEEKYWALHWAFRERNANILLFIFDCLDVQLTPSDIRSVIRNDNIKNPFKQRLIDEHIHERPDVFQRILNYFTGVDNHQLRENLEEFCSGWFWEESTALEVKQENIKRNVGHLLDFLDSHREKVKFLFDSHHFAYENMHVTFMHHEDDGLMKKYFTLMSSFYSDDKDLTRFVKKVIQEYQRRRGWQISRIEKTLTVLRDLGRTNKLPGLSRYVLFKHFEILQQDNNMDIRSSLEEMGKMTGLYGTVFRGDLKTIEKEIGCSLENPKPETCSENVNSSFLRSIMNANEENLIRQFEVAAAYGHEEICRKILPGMNDDNTNKSIRDAILVYNNVVMYRTILKSVKALRGHNALIDLLKPVFSKCNYFTERQIFETLFTFIVVEEDKENCYRDLNELVFQNYHSIQKLEYVPSCDILQGMIAEEGGFDEWIRRLMDTDINWAFDLLRSDELLDKFNQIHQIPKLIDIIITLRPSLNEEGTTSSYWSEYAKHEYSTAEYFIKPIAKRCGEDDLKLLLFARDEKILVVFFQVLIRRGRDLLERVLFNLPEKLKKEIEDLLKEETPQLIDNLFSSPNFLATLDDWKC